MPVIKPNSIRNTMQFSKKKIWWKKKFDEEIRTKKE